MCDGAIVEEVWKFRKVLGAAVLRNEMAPTGRREGRHMALGTRAVSSVE